MPPIPKGSLLCFDLDDTIWDVVPAIQGAETGTLKWLQERFPNPGATAHLACSEKYEAVREEVFRGYPELVKLCDFDAIRGHIVRNALTLGEVCEEEVDKHVDDAVLQFRLLRSSCTTLFDHGERVLTELSARHTLSVLTNGTACLNAAGVAQYFSYHTSPTHGHIPKPHPSMFESVLAHFDTPPDQVIMIGDDPVNDIRPALALGMKAIWVNVLGRKGVFFVVSRLREIKVLGGGYFASL